MVIIETKVFTRRVTSLLTDDEYRDLQSFLVEHPDVGDAVQGTPGLRKVRWSAKGHAKDAVESASYTTGPSTQSSCSCYLSLPRMSETTCQRIKRRS